MKRCLPALLATFILASIALHAEEDGTSGAVLYLGGNNSGTYENTSITSAINTSGVLLTSGTLTLNSTSVLTQMGTLTNGATLSTGVINTTPGGTLVLDPTGGATVTSGTTIDLTKTGAGTLTLGNSNVIFGGTLLTSGGLTLGGTLVTNASNVISTGPLNGGPLTLGGSNLLLGGLQTIALPNSGPVGIALHQGTLALNVSAGSTLSLLPSIRSSGGTQVSFLSGSAQVSGQLSLQYLPVVQALASDALELHMGTLTGGAGDKFVLQMSYNPTLAVALGSVDGLYLGWWDPAAGLWKNAVAGNSDGGTTSRLVLGAYNAATDFQLGTYGVDAANAVVWAVIDHNSIFGVGNEDVQPMAPTPEPGSALLLAGAAGMLLARRWRVRAA